MKKIFLLSALSIVACQPSVSEKSEAPTETVENKSANFKILPGSVQLRLTKPVSEPYACIIPIRVENGLDEVTSVTMIGFDVTGPGEDARGNMFAPAAQANAVTEARVIVEGQSCEAFDTLTIPDIRCTSGDKNCADKVELIDGGGLRFAKTG